MQTAQTETRRQRRERLYGPRGGKPNARICPQLPGRQPPRAAPLWDPVIALALWNGGLYGSWRDFDYKLIHYELGRPVLPYRN